MKIRPGMDLLVYDKENNYLQVIELKYKVPVESTYDIKKLDIMLDKAYKQVEEAEMFVEKNKVSILMEYFGEEYEKIVPSNIDYFILTNFSIGTGLNKELPTPIILIDHYIDLMNKNNGMELVSQALSDTLKLLPIKQEKRYARYSLCGSKILVPEFFFRLVDTI